MSETLTPRDVAELLRVHQGTVWRLLATGELPQPFYVAERRPRWHRAEIERWLESRRASPREMFDRRRRRRAERAAT